ncbi:MAG: hypothetical protein ACLPY1_05950 [Terracidiphilus sp.]
MNNCKEIVGYFVAKICDLESAESATNPPQDIPLSFRFAVDSEGNELDMISALDAFLDIASIPVAILWRDLKSGKVSVGYPDSIPSWLRTVVSHRAPDLIDDVVSCLAGNYKGDSGKWC